MKLKKKVTLEVIKSSTVIRNFKSHKDKPERFLQYIHNKIHLYTCFESDKKVYKSVRGDNLIYIGSASSSVSFANLVFLDIVTL